MSFDDALKAIQTNIDTQLLVAARDQADPVTFLNLQFALNEKNLKSKETKQKAMSFEEILSNQREHYYSELRKKTEWARSERRRLYNLWWHEQGDRISNENWNNARSRAITAYTNSAQKRYWMYANHQDVWSIDSDMDSMSHELLRKQFISKNLSTEKFNTAFVFEALRELEKTNGEMNHGWGGVLHSLMIPSPLMAVLMRFAFPSVDEYLSSPKDYPYFIDFLENHPFPSPELMDLAAKKACRYGESEYEADMLSFLEKVNLKNISSDSWTHYYFLRPGYKSTVSLMEDHKYSAEWTFGRPEINPTFNWNSYSQYRNANYLGGSVFEIVMGWQRWPDSACQFKRRNSSSLWWWPRPRNEFVFIAKVGFVNPKFLLPWYIKAQRTAFGYSEAQRLRIERQRQREQKRRNRGGVVGGFIRGIVDNATDPFQAIGASIGGAMRLLRPDVHVNEFIKHNNLTKDMYREINNFSGGFLDQMEIVSDIPAKWVRGEAITEQDLMLALDLAIKAAVIAASGGSAVALVGVTSSQLQRGSWGRDELGSIVLQVGELAAVAYYAGGGVDQIVGEIGERVVVDQARQVIYRQTDLDETALGTFVVELGTRSGQRVYNGTGVVDAILEGSDKAAALAIAKESPEAAMMLGMVLAVRRSGIGEYYPGADGDTDPESWYNNFSFSKLGEGISTAWKSLESSERRKIIGLGIMVAAGKLKGSDALKIIGQSMAIRQIEKFYSNQPVTMPSNQEMERRAQIQAQVTKFKNEEMILQKVRQGQIPTPREMTLIADSATANWAWDSITSVVPSEGLSDAWNIQFKIGFPDWSIDFPNIKTDLKQPEWSKIGSVDMPEWSKIKVKEEYRKKLEDSLEKTKKGIMSKLQWENILYAYLTSLWPPNVPLRPVGSRDPYDFNYIDSLGNLKVRPALNFPYDHPMLAHGLIERRLSEDEKAYQSERNREIMTIVSEYQKATGESLNYTTLPGGDLTIEV